MQYYLRPIALIWGMKRAVLPAKGKLVPDRAMRRYVVMGAGALGAGIGGRLVESGARVLFVARGAHGRALAERGLELAEPDGTRQIRVEVRLNAEGLQLGSEDIVLLCVKSQHTEQALSQLNLPRRVPVVCVQNGVSNEVIAARMVDQVIGALAWIPATLLCPGRVEIHARPAGMLMFGAWPTGLHPLAEALQETFQRAGFQARAVPDIRRYKYTKLLSNLLGTAQALCGPDAELSAVRDRLIAEGEAALQAAGIDYAPLSELLEAASAVLSADIDGAPRRGGSTWQSVARGSSSIETQHLNGEIVQLGRRHGTDVSLNARLLHGAARGLVRGWPAVQTTPEALLAELPSGPSK